MSITNPLHVTEDMHVMIYRRSSCGSVKGIVRHNDVENEVIHVEVGEGLFDHVIYEQFDYALKLVPLADADVENVASGPAREIGTHRRMVMAEINRKANLAANSEDKEPIPAMTREGVAARLAAYYSEKLNGPVSCEYDDEEHAYCIRGERLPAAPEMQSTYPNGWSMMDFIGPLEAYAKLQIMPVMWDPSDDPLKGLRDYIVETFPNFVSEEDDDLAGYDHVSAIKLILDRIAEDRRDA